MLTCGLTLKGCLFLSTVELLKGSLFCVFIDSFICVLFFSYDCESSLSVFVQGFKPGFSHFLLFFVILAFTCHVLKSVFASEDVLMFSLT